MSEIEEIKAKLKVAKQEYRQLLDDYKILKDNMRHNINEKARVRKEISALQAQKKSLGQ